MKGDNISIKDNSIMVLSSNRNNRGVKMRDNFLTTSRNENRSTNRGYKSSRRQSPLGLDLSVMEVHSKMGMDFG